MVMHNHVHVFPGFFSVYVKYYRDTYVVSWGTTSTFSVWPILSD